MIIKTLKEHTEYTKHNVYFVYCFLDTRKPGKYIFGDYEFDHEPIYIGKGKGMRPNKHYVLYKSINTRFYSKMQSIIDKGFNPDYILLKENMSEDESFENEKYFISLIGRIENGGTLTNLSDGGEGQSGFKFSEESKLNMSRSRLGKKIGPMSEETKLKISISKVGKPTKLKGFKMSEETKQKLSIKAKERTGDKNSMFGKKHTTDSIEKMSQNREKLYGENNPNFGRVYRESEKTFDRWEITNTDGEVMIIDNLAKFCLDNNLNASCMRDIMYGRMKNHKGWIKVIKLTNNVIKKKPDI